jgi:hypothetical protein
VTVVSNFGGGGDDSDVHDGDGDYDRG